MNLINIKEATELVTTQNFKWAHFPFEKFNIIQSSIHPYVEENCNFVVSASTSAGKTVLAEMLLSHEIRKSGKKGIYLSPLKSLSQEKYTDWLAESHHFKDLNVSICTGDYRFTANRIKELEKSDVIVMTFELLNSCARNFKSEKSQFLKDVGIIAVDECHNLGEENRGPHLEAGLMKFTELNPESKLLMISATMANVNEVGSWVSTLNNKDTRLLVSSYRPCKLNMHFEKYQETGYYEENEQQKVMHTVRIIKKFPDDKFICFVHGKKIGETLHRVLTNMGIVCDFHNANLDKDKRVKIEEQFRTDKRLRVIIATSTIAQGLNMPARRVIVLGVHRGLSEVDAQTIIQECVDENSRIMLYGQNNLFKLAKDIKLGDKVLGIKNNNSTSGIVTKIYRSNGPAKKIYFSNGSSGIFSNHPILLWNGNWESSDNLNVGDKVCIVTNNINSKSDLNIKKLFFEKLKDNCNEFYCDVNASEKKKLKEKYGNYLKDYIGYSRQKDISKFMKSKSLKLKIALDNNIVFNVIRPKNNTSNLNLNLIDENFSYLMGVIATDGNIKNNKKHTLFRVTLRDKSITDRIAFILNNCKIPFSYKKIKKKSYKTNKRTYWQIYCNNCCLIKIFQYIGLTPRKTRTLNMKDMIKLNNKEKFNFISGIIDGDGSYNNKKGGKKIRIVSASIEFIHQIKDILLSLDIRSNVNKVIKKGLVFNRKFDTSYYVLTISKISDINKIIMGTNFSSKLPNKIIKIKGKSNADKGDLYYVKVNKIENIENSNLVNFKVDDCDTFVVENIVTHNCGRAGRPQYDTEGDAYILVPSKTADYHERRIKEPQYIHSQMSKTKTLAFHLVSEIHHGGIKSIDDVHRWYERTLAHHQKKSLDQFTVDEILKHLLYCGSIKEEGGEIKVTTTGMIASMFYYSPFDVADLNKNFTKLFESDKAEYDTYLSMALGNIDSNRSMIVSNAERAEMEEYMHSISGAQKLLGSKIGFTHGAIKAGFCYYLLLNGKPSNNFYSVMQAFKMDFGRTNEILSALNTMLNKWDQSDFIRRLGLRIQHGVSDNLVDLCCLKGIGKVKAQRLWAAGIRELKNINDPVKIRSALGCSQKVAEGLVKNAIELLKGDNNV